MMYAILKNNRGLPVALFAIERETSKRFYGKLEDTTYDTFASQRSWFWLPGLTTARDKVSYVTKDIVMFVTNSDSAWFSMKGKLQGIERDYKSCNKLIQDEANRARIRTREQEEDNEKRARLDALEEIGKYVCKADML